MIKKLENSIIVITGTSSGIGRATALELARRGARLVLVSRQKVALEELAMHCREFGAEVLVAPADTADASAMQEIAKRTAEEFGRIDVWINNAAVTLFGWLEETPLEDIRRVIETNLFGYINGARAALPYFREQGSGILINVSSGVGKTGQAFTSPYVISKFGIIGLSKVLRQDLADERDIHVITVLPASIDTPLFQHGANFTGRVVKPIPPIYSAEMVAKKIVHSIKNPRDIVFAGNSARIVSIFNTLFPSAYDRIAPRQVQKRHFQDYPASPSHGNLFEPDPSLNTISGGWIKGRKGLSLNAVLAGSALMAVAFYLAWRR